MIFVHCESVSAVVFRENQYTCSMRTENNSVFTVRCFKSTYYQDWKTGAYGINCITRLI